MGPSNLKEFKQFIPRCPIAIPEIFSYEHIFLADIREFFSQMINEDQGSTSFKQKSTTRFCSGSMRSSCGRQVVSPTGWLSESSWSGNAWPSA